MLRAPAIEQEMARPLIEMFDWSGELKITAALAKRLRSPSVRIPYFRTILGRLVAAIVFAVSLLGAATAQAELSLLNVSYDPTRKFYRVFNALFAADWKSRMGETVTIRTSQWWFGVASAGRD
jgi:hypothetical protein